MRQIKTIQEALDFAINSERNAYELYNELALKSENGHSRDILLGFAAEEASHRRKLEAVKAEKLSLPAPSEISIFVIDDPLNSIKPNTNMTFKEALLFAMSLEKKAVSFYLDLARTSRDPLLKNFFRQLAAEEGKHDEHFETIYKGAFEKKDSAETEPPKIHPIENVEINTTAPEPISKNVVIEETSRPEKKQDVIEKTVPSEDNCMVIEITPTPVTWTRKDSF